MKICPQCQSMKIQHGVFPAKLQVAGVTFTAETEMDRCRACGEFMLRPWAAELFFLQVALYFARSGSHSPEAFRFMRRQIGLNMATLAELLDLRPETVSRIETGKAPIDRRTIALVAAMVEDRARGSTETMDALRALGVARKQAKAVVLERIGSYEEQIEKLPPGAMRDTAVRALRDHQSGRTEQAFTKVLAPRAAARIARVRRRQH